MATINFYLQSDKNPSGIYVRVREGRNIDSKAKTKYAINPKDWNTKKGIPNNLKDEGLKKLNEALIGFQSELLNHYNKSVNLCLINSVWLKDFINPPIKSDTIPLQLVAYFDYFLIHRKNSISNTSYSKYNSIKHLVERFQKKENTIYFIKDVNADFKLKFDNFCIANLYRLNTYSKAFKFIKTVCYNARDNGLEIHHQLNKRLITKTEKVEKIFLTAEEIDKIQKKVLKVEHLDNARDWLIISCEVGQRVSDFLNFSKEMIRYIKVTNKVGKKVNVPLIEFTQVKTQKIMAIPLSNRVQDILKKRDGNFPRKLSSQHYNQYIKKVCEIVGLTKKINGSKINLETNRKQSGLFPKFELVTSHIGRRSYATNNYGIIPTSLLIYATGHTTEKMFLVYIGKTETEKAIQLASYYI